MIVLGNLKYFDPEAYGLTAEEVANTIASIKRLEKVSADASMGWKIRIYCNEGADMYEMYRVFCALFGVPKKGPKYHKNSFTIGFGAGNSGGQKKKNRDEYYNKLTNLRSENISTSSSSSSSSSVLSDYLTSKDQATGGGSRYLAIGLLAAAVIVVIIIIKKRKQK